MLVSGKVTPSILGTSPSFGFGDRLGLATPGHVAALQEAGGSIRGIFSQQSIREMERTARTPEQVMSAAAMALEAVQYTEHWGADADHLKTREDVDRTVSAGFSFFTLDPSDDVDQRADNYDHDTLEVKLSAVRDCTPWIDEYCGTTVQVGDTKICLDQVAVVRTAVKYGVAIMHAMQLAEYVERTMRIVGRKCELELSVDETEQPTTPAEHYIIADQFRQAGIRLISLAPRFVGSFEKGIDYKGDLLELEASLQVHADIARELGPYKLSLHSGSDKLSMYPILARATQGMFHVKTAGTSYLEALRVVALHDPKLFREIVTFSRNCYDRDKATYHVSATNENTASPNSVNDLVELERLYLERWEDVPEGIGFTASGRQILHCTFGSVLTHERFGPLVMDIVGTHQDTYTEVLRDHFARHLRSLNTG